MGPHEKWPSHVHVVIWLAAISLVSGIGGNWLGYQQWKHPIPLNQSNITADPLSMIPSLSIIPFLMTSGASVVSVLLLMGLTWRHRSRKEDALAVLPASLISTPNKANRSAMEQMAFNKLRDDFTYLKWAQKVAVKLICDGRASHQLSLVSVLDEMGFGNANVIMEEIVKPVSGCDLLALRPDGVLTANHARLRDVEEIVNEWSAHSSLGAFSDAPQRIATTLHLYYDNERRPPTIVSSQNVRRWYSLANVSQFRPKKGPPQETIIITLFITFEFPAAMKQLTVRGGKATMLPIYEVKDCTAWSAVVTFSGPILGGVEIEALL